MDAPPRTYALRRPPAFVRPLVDRATERRRDAEWLAGAWRDGGTRVLVVADGRAPVRDGGLVLVPPAEAPTGDVFLLGVDGDGTAYFAVRVDGPHPDPDAASLREAGRRLGDFDGALMAHAVALANWHAAHQHCSRCGAPTDVGEAGHVRRCPVDGSEHYPRTDPVVIVLVVDESDRCLLGHQSTWPEGRFSTLAGFVEPGETPEQAVVREVHEETAVAVRSCTYAGSQPWPFPSSLMLGYYAQAAGTPPRPDGEEISDARWFTREELADALQAGEVRLPPSVAISHRLIEGWYGADL
ncbi:MAG: NAD(+) diphosphatase [Actinomycetota bacterium]